MDPTRAFQDQRPRLLRLAYRMLGTLPEAEDVVQEAYMRWYTKAPTVENPQAYLSSIVTRLCLDVLKSPRFRKQHYYGQWLPDLLVDHTTPESMRSLAEDLSYGFMLILERLTPEQRAVYVLRVAFDMEYAEIAAILGSSSASCRQLMKKARDKVLAPPLQRSVDPTQALKVADAFMDAWNSGDKTRVAAMLAESCHFRSEGDGVVKVAQRVIVGATKVSRLLCGLNHKYGLVTESTQKLSGLSPILWLEADSKRGIAILDVQSDLRIIGVFCQWNPAKILRVKEGLEEVFTSSRAESSVGHT